ncbi:GGDEF domain-containing protein [Mangrovicella endophytica]|uniref:GGDEF domain-containing protein n=1 Tax=Mangrovicella endophytica TaxID=2066697 RepID=UPI000C9E2D40|nr:sensor domain-containing diguanylate cyclase [Mangrovicella endophytica]
MDQSLDFFTLYVVIVALALSLTAVWGAIAWQNRGFASARTWFIACLVQAGGGLMLPFQYGANGVYVAALANGLIVYGFWLFWMGLRRFQGERPEPGLPVAASLACAALTVALFASNELIALLYAVSQIAPMAAMLASLIRHDRGSIGAVIACSGLAVGIAGHVVVIGMNLVILASSGPVPDWSATAALTMLGVIFSGLLLNFGLTVATIDHLRDELATLADTDPLTGVLNRRGLERWLSSDACGRAERHGVLALDLNEFKQINDRFGHDTGDECLIHFARLIRAQLDDEARLARLGGDEFCIILPDAGQDDCNAAAASIQAALASSPLIVRRQKLHLACSIGGVVWHHRAGMAFQEAFATADKALYARKSRRSA